jgi:hypothetical protein
MTDKPPDNAFLIQGRITENEKDKGFGEYSIC